MVNVRRKLALRIRNTRASLLEAMADESLFGRSFEGSSWEAWRAVLAGAFALPMSAKQRKLFHKLAGGRPLPRRRVRELWVVAGRRSAKTKVAAAIAVYLATVGAMVDGVLEKLSPGERGVISLLAVDRAQARVALGYIEGLIDDSPMLQKLADRRNADSIDFEHVSIEVATNDYRRVRGRTLIACILDECAFYRSEESATPDVETYRGVLPGLATTGGLLIGVSSPYARRGLLYSKHKKHYGQDGDVLVVQGGTTDFNPTIDRRVIQEAEIDDPEAAHAEWHGQFRRDIAAFISREALEAVVVEGRRELPPVSEIVYSGFLDFAGGSGSDSATVAVAHSETRGDQVFAVLDALREIRPPFSPDAACSEFAAFLKSYGVYGAISDRWGGDFPIERMTKHGVSVTPSASPKSDLYLAFLPIINSGRCELLDEPRLIAQLMALERRTARGGRDSVDHGPGFHDDLANAVAGALLLCSHGTMSAEEFQRGAWALPGAATREGRDTHLIQDLGYAGEPVDERDSPFFNDKEI